MTPQQASMSKYTLLTPSISPSPEQQNGHQPDTGNVFMPQPQALVSSIASALEDSAQDYQVPSSKSTPSTSQAQGPQSRRDRPSDMGRVLILCFDGTGKKFGENSNIIRLFRTLKKSSQKDQVLYYQSGIGTYNKREFITSTMNSISNKIDFAIANHLNEHVKDGYRFIIQNYKPGDKICLFGYSRGAHTARVLAGMVYKVGMLPRDNLQQVDSVFDIYMTTGDQGYKLSREFKLTFATHVEIDFVGVWDTVSSVGLIPQTHPYASINYSVKCFRHALALDERRANFRPTVWGERTVDSKHELDVDFPVEWNVDRSNPDEWQYTPPDRSHADVKEVWFAGSHSDVGGCSHDAQRSGSLSNIPLRWMIKECVLAKTGIQFDMEYLRDELDFDFDDLEKEMTRKNMRSEDLGEAYLESRARAQQEKEKEASKSADANAPVISETHFGKIRRHIHDIFDDVFDPLVINWFWWILEIIPMITIYQDLDGNWISLRMRNLGRGRDIPFYNNKIFVHESVNVRINERYPEMSFRPKAHNWDRVQSSPMLEYVS